MDSLSDRIRRRLTATRKSARRASLEAGLSAWFVQNIVAGKTRSPSAENLARLAAVLGAREQWLLRGEGSEEAFASEPASTGTTAAAVPQWGAREYRRLRADAAGKGRPRLASDREWQIPAAYLRDELRTAPDDLAFLEVTDEAMASTLMPGDLVLVDFSERGPTSGVFLVHDGGGAAFRRLEIVINSDPLQIRVSVDNPRRTLVILPPGSLVIFGKAVWRGRKI